MITTDLLIIGGGINGCGIAADAAGRGLSTILCEQNDLASGTSSASSKLIHGGLRYLEHYEFRLVQKALQEREILLRKAPHIIFPLQFIMPHHQNLRPAWLIRTGLFLYDHLGGKISLPKSYSIHFKQHSIGKAIKETFQKGFVYSDCCVDDARLVILNAIAAKHNGATILTRTQLTDAKRYREYWEATLKNQLTAQTQIIRAKVLINAAGPWVENILNKLSISSKNHIVLVKGSHIVVPKLYPDNFAFILQHTDRRIIFVIPYEEHYSLIGTTDVPFTDDFYDITISQNEIDYLLNIVNTYFRQSITLHDIVWNFSGLRALKEDKSNNPSAITRDYELELNEDHGLAPLLSIFGGKITTYRILAESVLEKCRKFFPHCGPAWTEKIVLPGGEIPEANFNKFFQVFKQRYSWLPIKIAYRYARSYGTYSEKLIGNAKSINDLGQDYGNGLYEAEFNYLYQYEWAMTIEDVLWRRTKLGLHFTKEEILELKKVKKV